MRSELSRRAPWRPNPPPPCATAAAVVTRSRKRQAQGRVAAREVEAFGIEAGEPPRPVLGAEELGRVEPHGFGVVCHSYARRRLSSASIRFSAPAISVMHVGGFQIGGAGKAAIEVGGDDVEPPEREIAEAGIKLRFRMAGEEAPAQARLVCGRRARSGRSCRAASGADAPAGRPCRPMPAAARRGRPLRDWRCGWRAGRPGSAASRRRRSRR